MTRMMIAAGILLAGVMSPLAAQDYPNKPIRLVVPNTPSGALDVTARLTQQRMMEFLGQPLVFDYRVGAGGVVGTNHVAQSPADGYTLIIVVDSFTANPYLYQGVQYDPVKSFAPISLMVTSAQVLAVSPGGSVKNFAEFMPFAKAKGSALDFGTAGAGSSSRLTIELFRQVAGLGGTLIHYNGGGPLVPAVMGGQVPVTIITMGVVVPQIKSGKLLALAVTTPRRSKVLPDVPTVAEFFPGFESRVWVGLLAPAGTPQPIVDRLNAAMSRALAGPEVRERLESQSYEIVASTPDELGAWVKNESSKVGRLIKDLNIKIN